MKKLIFVLVLAVTISLSVSDFTSSQSETAAGTVIQYGDKEPGPVHS